MFHPTKEKKLYNLRKKKKKFISWLTDLFSQKNVRLNFTLCSSFKLIEVLYPFVLGLHESFPQALTESGIKFPACFYWMNEYQGGSECCCAWLCLVSPVSFDAKQSKRKAWLLFPVRRDTTMLKSNWRAFNKLGQTFYDWFTQSWGLEYL